MEAAEGSDRVDLPLLGLRPIAAHQRILFALLALAAQAQPFPNKPLKIIVPAAPGGTTDIASRLLGKRMAEVMGQPVVVENKAGGGGIIGSQALKQSAPDGYTLIMGNIGPNAINFGLSTILHIYKIVHATKSRRKWRIRK